MIVCFLSNRYNESIMKRMSAVFPITCILLTAAGASGLVMDFMLAVEKMKDIDCPKFLALKMAFTLGFCLQISRKRGRVLS